MKRVKLLLAALALFLLASGSYLALQFNQGSTKAKVKADPNYRLSQEEKDLLQEGDIILRRGEGFVSSVIANLDEVEYNLSHCAFITKGQKDWMIIHSVSKGLSGFDGVQAETLDHFSATSVAKTLVVLRLKTDYNNRVNISKRARYYLDQKVPFDHGFDLSDTTTFYCTELLQRSIQDVLHRDVFASRFRTDHPHYVHFDALLDTTEFELILNHQGQAVTQFMGLEP